jgi:hypothetical protein
MEQEGNSSFAEKDNPWHRLVEWIGTRPSVARCWDAVRQLKASAEDALLPYKDRYNRLERQWKRKLKPLCGNSCSIDWEKFRPLRLSREEDWSDWLAWLLETSTTGLFAEILLGTFMNCDQSSFRSSEKKVWREVLTENRERRADIVAEWKKHLITHVELKLEDQQFEKTFETCRLLRARWPKEANWTNAILIPETSRAAWKSVAEKYPTENISEILWNDVAHGLRKCLWMAREPIFWRAWAWSFCCAVETHILHLRSPDRSKPGLNQLATAARWVEILAMDPREASLSMKPEMKAFLEDGVRLYGDAMDAVTKFEDEILKLLRTAIDARAHWEPMKNRSIKKPVRGGDGGERWLYTMVEGESERGERAQIECGLWWNARRTTEPIVHAGLWRVEERLERVKFNWVDGTDGIHSFEYDNGTYIYLPARGSIEIEGPVNRLLDAVLKQLCKMAK